jgi:GDPmannose 4,6-dehydratase
MLQQDEPEDYVIATGVGASVRDFANAAFGEMDLDYREFVVHDSRYERATEVSALIGDASKAADKLKWVASTQWRELAKIMVKSDYALFAKE